jgi:GxxExxY protein
MSPASQEFELPTIPGRFSAFYYVHNQLGYGCFERTYAEALSRKLRKLSHVVEREVRTPIFRDREQVGLQKLDMPVDSRVIVEIKSSFQLCDADHRQLRSPIPRGGKSP